MKQILMKFVVVACLTTLAASSAQALTATQVKALKKKLKGVPVAEMPARAAELVREAAPQDRQAVATAILRTVTLERPAAARSVEKAISLAPALPALSSTSAAAPAPTTSVGLPTVMDTVAPAAPVPTAVVSPAPAPSVVSPQVTSAVAVSAPSVTPSTVTTRGNALKVAAAAQLTQSKQGINGINHSANKPNPPGKATGNPHFYAKPRQK